MSVTYRSEATRLVTEKELRAYVEQLYNLFPEEYQRKIMPSPELRVVDDREFTEYENRYLDLALRNNRDNKMVVVEYKQGILTDLLVSECLFRRGYLELCVNQIPNFSMFVFVGQSVHPSAKEMCDKLSENKRGIQIRTSTYPKMAEQAFRNYLLWAKSTNRYRYSDIVKTAIEASQVANEWLDEDWLENELRVIYLGEKANG